ncbi:proteasome subunit beta type-7-like isoform X1 [Acropora millepora]|uniref:proteasome subunit beta type-7-like isoform X1 n=1 Tax=Acropora millepora TaxID=45264 RepID=UPI001CF1494F|nr:proteasome subunit beta type-7-like isoform X1 [Acropora millepora]
MVYMKLKAFQVERDWVQKSGRFQRWLYLHMHCKNDSTKTFKMAAIGGTVAQEHCGGFSFENCKRVVLFLGLIQEQQRILLLLIRIVPRFTTLLQIFSKYTQKDLWCGFFCCCGAGTAADTEYVTQLISSNIQLHSLSTGRQVMVHWLLCQCLSLDVNLTWSLMKLKKLVCDAIAAGIFNDLGSGSNVDLCIIPKEGTEYLRPYNVANDKGVRQGRYSYKRGTTAVLTKDIKPIVVDVTETTGRGHGDVIYQLLCLPSFKI